jgi:hypothetical protein
VIGTNGRPVGTSSYSDLSNANKSAPNPCGRIGRKLWLPLHSNEA